jgi:hypothetical protein
LSPRGRDRSPIIHIGQHENIEGICLASKYLVCLAARTLRIKDGPIGLDVADIKKLGVLETVFPTSTDVRLHVIQLSKLPRECNVALISEAGAAEHDDAVLFAIGC